MLQFQVVHKQQRHDFEHPGGPIELGRGPARNGVPRHVLPDLYVSADHVGVVELDGGRARVTNLSQRHPIRLADGTAIAMGDSRDMTPPIHMVVGETYVSIFAPLRETPPAGLSVVAAPPLHAGSIVTPGMSRLGPVPTCETLAYWLETVIAVQRAAAGSPEFFQQTARAVVELIGLDRGLVLLLRLGRWAVQARYAASDESDSPAGREFSLTMLDRMARERRTLYQAAGTMPPSESLRGVEAVVAAPVLDADDRVVGAIYGSRTGLAPQGGGGIGSLEAQLVQLLAATVGVGLARAAHEAEAARLRVQFEQFFSADLARELQRNPYLLEGREREVTVLFGDVRGFTRLAARLGPAEACRLIADVMGRLTGRVQEFDGTVVDYAGDGLMAVWNAPADQPDHAAKACRAASAMLAELPRLDADWRPKLGEPLRVGLGLNSGPALCGNIGSRLKFKYGALGHTVNLASRVESATKRLGVPLLLTGSTLSHCGEYFATRRLCKARLAGVADAVDLYELHDGSPPQPWLARRDAYERALRLYEAGDWNGACEVLYPLVTDAEHDEPVVNLMVRAVDAFRSPPEDFDGAFDFGSK
jgi:adenylate cyclase